MQILLPQFSLSLSLLKIPPFSIREGKKRELSSRIKNIYAIMSKIGLSATHNYGFMHICIQIFFNSVVSSSFFYRTSLMHCPCRQNYFQEKMSDGRNLLQFSSIFAIEK